MKTARKPRLSTVIKNYNNLLVIPDHLNYGTVGSEIHEEWNIRDFVAEVDYHLSMLTGDSCLNESDSDDEEVLDEWRTEVKQCEQFIKKYAKYIEEFTLSSHCSGYDNRKA